MRHIARPYEGGARLLSGKSIQRPSQLGFILGAANVAMIMSFLPAFAHGPALSLAPSAERAYTLALQLLAFSALLLCLFLARHNVLIDFSKTMAQSPLVWVCLLFCALAIASAMWSPSPFLTLGKGLQLALICFFGLSVGAICALASVPVAGLMTACLFCAGALMLVVNGLLFGNPLFITTFGERGRLVLGYTHPLVVGNLAALAAISSMFASNLGRTKFVLFAVGATGALLADARLALASLLFVGALSLLTSSTMLKRRLHILAPLLGVTGLGVVVAGGRLNLWSVIPADLYSLSGRIPLWRFVAQLIRQRPWTGYGYFSGRYLLLQRFPWSGHAHSSYLEVGISLGACGLALLAAFLSFGAVVSFRRSNGFSLAIFIYCLMVGFLNPIFFFTELPFLILLVALSAGASNLRQSASHN